MNTELIKSLGGNISITVLLVCFATVPLPGFDGNPTGAKYVHDHAIEWIRRNTSAISNTRESMIAMDDRKGIQFQLWQLEALYLQTNESEKLTEEKRDRLLNRYERKIDKLEEKLEKKNETIETLEGMWSSYGIAQVSDSSDH